MLPEKTHGRYFTVSLVLVLSGYRCWLNGETDCHAGALAESRFRITILCRANDRMMIGLPDQFIDFSVGHCREVDLTFDITAKPHAQSLIVAQFFERCSLTIE